MDISRVNMDDLFRGFKASFQKGLGMAPSKFLQFSMIEQSNSASDVYPMSAILGAMRKWEGDRKATNLVSIKMIVANEPYEQLVSVSKWDVADDVIGHYAGAFADLGQKAGKLWNDLAITALKTPPVWADGGAFFGTTRKYGKTSVISNKSTAALSETTYATARQAMLEYNGYDGKPLGVMPNLLIVGPKNEKNAFTILKDRLMVTGVATIAGATDNPWSGSADYVVLPELQGDYDDYWFLCDTSSYYKPVLVQQRLQPQVIRKDGPTDDNMFYGATVEYGVEARGAAILTFPHLIYGGIL